MSTSTISRLILPFLLLLCGIGNAATVTRTLPVVYINTDGKQGIHDTETQVPCGIYIDSVRPEYPSLGSSATPIRATIKGRGNWTWNGFDKKPYKIKFDEKQKVLGMPNNRHWCLLAGADDWLGFMRNPLGHLISEAVGMRWTPRMRPVEVVLNGKYIGFYFLTEHVRIASHRVKIHEQADGETHADSISGGWLVEIDNYRTENNIEFTEGNGQYVMVSLREPKTLSSAQRSYIEQQLYALNNALYASDGQIETLLDMDEAAKYYIVQEVMEDCESYHGSCFLYKDRDSLGIADKWKFGPVWDFGNAYNRHEETWIYDRPTWPQYWIGQLATKPAFRRAVSEQWWVFYHEQKDSVRTRILALADQIETAAKRDAEVWRGTQGYCDNSNFADVRDRLLRRYDWRTRWLYQQWGEGTEKEPGDHEQSVHVPSDQVPSTKVLRDGRLYILYKGTMYDVRGRRVNN